MCKQLHVMMLAIVTKLTQLKHKQRQQFLLINMFGYPYGQWQPQHIQRQIQYPQLPQIYRPPHYFPQQRFQSPIARIPSPLRRVPSSPIILPPQYLTARQPLPHWLSHSRLPHVQPHAHLILNQVHRTSILKPTQLPYLTSPQRVVHSPLRFSRPDVILSYSPNHSFAQSQLVRPPHVHLYSPPRIIQQQPLEISIQQAVPMAQSYARPPQQTPQVRQAPGQQARVSPVKQPVNQQPQQNSGVKPDKDELEKRFTEALDRTKKIVEKFQQQERLSPPPRDELPKQQPKQQQQQQQKPDQRNDPRQVQPPIKVQEKSDDDEDDDENPLEGKSLVLSEELALQYEDGYIYRGQGILPQTREGFGVLTDANEQEVYAGFWKDNFYNGEGRLNNLNPEVLKSSLDYTNMTTIGNGWLQYQGTGEFNHGKMHGRGHLQLTNNETYTGEFAEGMVDGEGTFKDKSGKEIKGRWEQGFFQN